MHRSISSPSSLRGGSYAWRYGVTAGALVLLAACGGSGAQAPGTDTTPAPATGPRVVQAGAPGESSRPFAAGNLDDLEGASYTEADVSFMQDMIHHHAQALQMTSLIGERTTTRAIEQMGLRMQISQGDEISIMERWLRDRGLEVPVWSATPPAHSMHHGTPGHEMMDHAAMDHGDEHAMMAGMLTPEQMAQLEAARGRDFDRLFLELMIQHHEGALTMVMDLYNSPGAAQESTVYQFASEIDADQAIEIGRMRELLEAWR
jgi:uncharacterized protein (DUF305 family)